MHEKIATKSSENDAPMVIACPACHKSVTAPAEMVGQTVECPFCQHHFVVTARPDPSAAKAELASMEGQLRENVSQITELRGHVSRLNMELHRHELRMKSLTERQAELQAGINAMRKKLGLS